MTASSELPTNFDEAVPGVARLDGDDRAMVQIDAFLFDEENEAKFAGHGLRPEQVDQILDGPLRVVANRKSRRGTYLVIGRDWGGACIATPIEPTHDPAVWRPITAWPCKVSEEGQLAHVER